MDLIINMFLFLSIVFIFTFLIGRLLEKIRVPWIFAALILGSILTVTSHFSGILENQTFTFLANLGMYFLLFVIGFQIDLHKMRKESSLILGTTFITILLGTIFGALVVRYAFGYDWVISTIVALSFSTVGEAILLPILDEFKIVKTNLGQTMIGIGVFDDLIEIVALVLVIGLVGSSAGNHLNTFLTITSLLALFGLTILFNKFGKEGKKFNFLGIETLFLFTIFVFFLFIGIGGYADSAPLAALLAGVSIRTFIPDERLKFIESEIRAMCYGLFAPIFFLWVGASVNLQYLATHPLLILLVIVVSGGAKLIGSYITARKELGVKVSLLLGIGLSVRFSTSIVIIKILFENNLIGIDLYSVLIASTIIFTFVIPVLFTYLLIRWNIVKQNL